MLSTIILGVWSPLGPLVGIRYGLELSKRLQSEHWVTDNEKQEDREVVGVITSSFGHDRAGRERGRCNWWEMRARNQAEQVALETPRDRLFIADELKRSTPSIAGSKRRAILTMIKDEKKFALRFGRIIFDIRKAALREGKKS